MVLVHCVVQAAAYHDFRTLLKTTTPAWARPDLTCKNISRLNRDLIGFNSRLTTLPASHLTVQYTQSEEAREVATTNNQAKLPGSYQAQPPHLTSLSAQMSCLKLSQINSNKADTEAISQYFTTQ